MADDRIPSLPTPETRPVSEPPAGKLPAAAVPRKKAEQPAASPHPKDSFRDIVETVVFVVVLVLLLKTFVAEAFVIPTGSMATTLWGYQKDVKCPECGEEFPVNCSSQVDPDSSPRADVIGCTCPNCRFAIQFPSAEDPSWHSGDRVLVAKFLYDSQLRLPGREDVVVFKFPDTPQKQHVARNYIKRLIGKPNETIGIYYGNLYVAEGLEYRPPHSREPRKEMFPDEYQEVLKLDAVRKSDDRNRKFQIVRKAPAQLLALSRIVYDNDHQASALAGKVPPRWTAQDGANWQPDNPAQPRTFQHQAQPDEGMAWLSYSHLVPAENGWSFPPEEARAWSPRLITDFLGYNAGKERDMRGDIVTGKGETGQNWVGDLMLECQLQIDQTAPDGEVRLELVRGRDRFQVRFRVAEGTCSLWRNDQELPSAAAASPVKGPGKYRVRFANFDERLTLWVDDELVFGDGHAYDPPPSLAPTASDLRPASVGMQNVSGSIARLRLLRDSYYTVGGQSRDAASMLTADWSRPSEFMTKLKDLPARTFYVQPGHYLCLGDNSPASSDGRDWGLVPESLLLGRALVIYFPFSRVGLIK